MRIKKTSNTRAIAGKVLNVPSESTTDTYSCDYLNNKINTQQITTANTNANDYKTTGFYFFTNTYLPTNAPSGTANGWLQVIELSNTAVKQIWHNRTNDNRMYIRVSINATTWSNWKEITPGDTGWIKATLNSGYTHNALASAGDLMYRRIGNTVYVKGSVKGFTAANTSCCQLPEGYRPATRIDFMLGTGGAYYSKGMMTSSGNLQMNYDSRGSYSADNWYSFCANWITEEGFPES